MSLPRELTVSLRVYSDSQIFVFFLFRQVPGQIGHHFMKRQVKVVFSL